MRHTTSDSSRRGTGPWPGNSPLGEFGLLLLVFVCFFRVWMALILKPPNSLPLHLTLRPCHPPENKTTPVCSNLPPLPHVAWKHIPKGLNLSEFTPHIYRPDYRPDDKNTHYPCGICDHTVNWNQWGVACETCGQWFHLWTVVSLVDSGFTCGQWFHLECQDIGSGSCDLGRSDVTWHCIICANANYPTVTFDLRGIDTSQHSLTSDSSLSVNMDCSFHPLHTSTPTKASKWTNTHNDHSVSRLWTPSL